MSRIFLSHSSKDKEFVENLAIRLTRAGQDVWYDKWEIRVGDSIADKIENGIKESDFLIVVLSSNSTESPWVRKELDAAIAKEIDRRGAYILPVLAESCDIPPLLAGKRYANFESSPDQAFEELLEAIVSSSDSIRGTRFRKSRKGNTFPVLAMQLYSRVMGFDYAMLEGEEEGIGFDHVTNTVESTIAKICAFLINDIGMPTSEMSREKGSFFQKVGYTNGSTSALIARSGEDFQVWETEVVAEMRYDADPTFTRKVINGLINQRQAMWHGVRYLVGAQLDDHAAVTLFKARGVHIESYLPSPMPMFRLTLPNWKFAQYEFSRDKKDFTPIFRLQQLSTSLLRIDVDFGDRYNPDRRGLPEKSCWPRSRPWETLRPLNVINEFRGVLRKNTT